MAFLVSSSNVTIFVLSADLAKSLRNIQKSHPVNIQKFTIEGGRWVDAICESEKEISPPGFKRLDDIKYGMRTA